MWMNAKSNDTRLQSCSTSLEVRLGQHKTAVKGEELGCDDDHKDPASLV
jgi:hypothetical protein